MNNFQTLSTKDALKTIAESNSELKMNGLEMLQLATNEAGGLTGLNEQIIITFDFDDTETGIAFINPTQAVILNSREEHDNFISLFAAEQFLASKSAESIGWGAVGLPTDDAAGVAKLIEVALSVSIEQTTDTDSRMDFDNEYDNFNLHVAEDLGGDLDLEDYEDQSLLGFWNFNYFDQMYQANLDGDALVVFDEYEDEVACLEVDELYDRLSSLVSERAFNGEIEPFQVTTAVLNKLED